MPIDLNCDVGESFGRYVLGGDVEVLPWITSANIACGFHAGDPGVMRKTVAMAVTHGVSIGAHPGFPDLVGFGRRAMALSSEELRDALIYQIGALMGFARVYGVRVQHVKPHGALYNLCANDERMGQVIVNALRELDPQLILFGLAGSRILSIARDAGLKAASEVFADRAYHADGSLVPRNVAGAVLTDPDVVAERVVSMVKNKQVTTINGDVIALEFETICVHGDTPDAAHLVKHITSTLRNAEILIAPVGSFLV